MAEDTVTRSTPITMSEIVVDFMQALELWQNQLLCDLELQDIAVKKFSAFQQVGPHDANTGLRLNEKKEPQHG